MGKYENGEMEIDLLAQWNKVFGKCFWKVFLIFPN